MSNPFRAERAEFKDPEGKRADVPADPSADDVLVDSRVIQRALSTIRDRLRLQDGEIDDLRAMIRSVHHQAAGEPPTQLVSRLDRLEELEPKFQKSLNEGQGRTAQRIAALESEMVEQGRGVQQLREVLSRTDSNLQRLLTELDRLVSDVAQRAEPRPLPAVSAASPASSEAHVLEAPVMESPLPPLELPELADPDDELDPDATGRWRTPALVLAVLCVLLLGLWFLASRLSKSGGVAARSDSAATLSPIEQARVFESEKNYPKAEAMYRDLLKKDPNNGEVIRHLASVLFREDKWDESAAVLKKLSGGDNTAP